MFRDREDAALQLARRLQGRLLVDPLVLAIPRGGVVVGAVLARELGADLDVVLARKLRAPGEQELAIGAISEEGHVHLDPTTDEAIPGDEYVHAECRRQLAEIHRLQQLFRAVRPAAPVAGRSVIITDDGIATGATMAAALKSVRALQPRELIVAVPVGAPDTLRYLRILCNDLVYLLAPRRFWAVGQFYADYTQVEDAQAVELLRRHGFHAVGAAP